MTHYRKSDASPLHYLPASKVHPADTYFHFSFANYHDPERMNFGMLRVLNDDDVRAHGGFARHPNADGVALRLAQDVNLYVSELTDPSARVTFSVKAGRQAYENNFEGSVAVAGVATLDECDALEVVGPQELEFSGARAHFVIIEMADTVPATSRASCRWNVVPA